MQPAENEHTIPAPDTVATDLRSGEVSASPAVRELRVGDRTVAIERRAFDLLVYLMRHPDRYGTRGRCLNRRSRRQ